MGFMDVNEHYLYIADFGTTGIRIINRDTLEERVIETGIMTHYVKLLYNYLLIVDMNNFHILDIEQNQIIATYQTNGEVTALCLGNPQGKQVYGYTTEGQLFRINLELKETMLYPFLQKDRIIALCSQCNHSCSKSAGHHHHLSAEQQEELDKNQQPIYVFDRRRQLHKLDYDVGKFVPSYLNTSRTQWDESKKVIMTNIGDCVIFSIGSSIFMKESEEK